MSCEFEMEITEGAPDGSPGFYRVDVLNSPAGEASGQLRLDVQALLRRRWELQATVLASAVTTRAAIPETERPIREVGEHLFTKLFTGPVYGRYMGSLAAAAERGEPLQLVLRIRTPELAALPWEMLFDPEIETYLCQVEPLLRYVNAPAPISPPKVHRPLRVLGVIAAPTDLPALDVSDEQQRMATALAELGENIELVWLTSGRWAELQSHLLAGPWHVVHFIGHGGFRNGEGVLAMVGPTGAAEYVSARRFTSLLSTASPPPQLVVLNSCSSGEAGAEDLFSSTASALVRSGVSAVVAMQFAVSDPAANAFTSGFYTAVAHNRSIGEAVRIGRIAIQGTGERTLEWVTPVLYLRGEDTPLFTLEASVGVRSRPPTGQTVEDAARVAALSGLYTEAQAELREGNFERAVTLLDNVLVLDAGYRDAAELRETARRRERAATAFERGLAAENSGNWSLAIGEYRTALADRPDDRETAEHLRACEANERTAHRHAQLRRRWRLSTSAFVTTLIVALAALMTTRELRNQTPQPPPTRQPPDLSTTSSSFDTSSSTAFPPNIPSTKPPPKTGTSTDVTTTSTPKTTNTSPPNDQGQGASLSSTSSSNTSIAEPTTSATSATSQPKGPVQARSASTGYCLDSDAHRAVYTNICQADNNFQHWNVRVYNGSFEFKNVSTSFCLDSNGSFDVYTNQCGDGQNAFQRWIPIRHSGGLMFKNVATGYCLDSDTSRAVYTRNCGDDNNYQHWTCGSTQSVGSVACFPD